MKYPNEQREIERAITIKRALLASIHGQRAEQIEELIESIISSVNELMILTDEERTNCVRRWYFMAKRIREAGKDAT